MPTIAKGPQVPVGPDAVADKEVVKAMRGTDEPITVVVTKRAGKRTEGVRVARQVVRKHKK